MLSMSKSVGWGWADDPIRAAGGRRHYNSVRRFRAEMRRREIRSYLAANGLSLLVPGAQRALAERFRVSEATISRDLVGIYADRGYGRACPFCGAKPLDEAGAFAIAEGHERFARHLRRSGNIDRE